MDELKMFMRRHKDGGFARSSVGLGRIHLV